MKAVTPLLDQFHRRITYLRLSVTDRCNLRCAYCMPERQQFLPRAEVLTLEELYDLSLAFIERGVTKLRLTGGEPLVRRDVMDLIRALGRRIGHGLEELTLTTNGTLLDQFANDLAASGVRRINISLDTLNRDTFRHITRRDDLDAVLAGIVAARQAGLQIKINTVALKGTNEAEIPALIEWAHGHGYSLSLIEVMPLGDVDEDRLHHYLPLPQVHEQLAKQWTLTPSTYSTGGPARYVDIAETGGRLGFITPLTNNFCDGCNRIRVTATGQLYPCLGGAEQVDLRAALRSANRESALARAMDQAMRIKPERHHFAIDEQHRKPALSRHMSTTGG